MATTSATGTGSVIDVNSIVSQLMTVERQPLVKLDTKEASFQAQLSAFGTVKGALSSFQSAVSGLMSVGKYQSLTATPSDSTVFTASAASAAVAGSYSLAISQLAQQQTLVAPGQTSTTSVIGSGTITFDFGTIAGNTFNATTGKYGTTLSATTTLGSTTITAPTANLAVGAAITGTGIPAGATVASIIDANNFTISAAATANGAAVPLQANATFTSNGNGTKTITIDATNNSLQGIANAINAANIGVSASIVNDGSATPYRLSLTSNNSGQVNSMKISVVESGAPGLAALLANNPASSVGQNMTQTMTGQNANFVLNGLSISKASNTVSDVIQGVTLNLLKPTVTTASLSVARDTSSVQSSIQAFVKAYNDLRKALTSVSSYDPATKTGAVLQGDATVLMLQQKLYQTVSKPLTGTGSALTTLSQAGVYFQKDGTMTLDTNQLNTAISNNFQSIAGLFATAGNVTDSLVSYSAATDATKPGNYAVNITQIAAQAKLTGNAAAGLTITAGVNDTLNMIVNGVNATAVIPAGTYNATSLASAVQSAINGIAAYSSANISVAVTQAAGVLTITSNQYGSTSGVTVGGNGATNLLGAAPALTPGADVIGTINGLAASGSGQFLTSTAGDSTGLKIQINGGATGFRGTVGYSKGYTYALNSLATSWLASGGPLDGVTKGINNNIKDVGKQRDALNQRLTQIEAGYRAQYTALDVMLSSMNTTSNYLTQQLANLPKPY